MRRFHLVVVVVVPGKCEIEMSFGRSHINLDVCVMFIRRRFIFFSGVEIGGDVENERTSPSQQEAYAIDYRA